eukprot:14284394-Heterocapsa_arctica.AAC.1
MSILGPSQIPYRSSSSPNGFLGAIAACHSNVAPRVGYLSPNTANQAGTEVPTKRPGTPTPRSSRSQ